MDKKTEEFYIRLKEELDNSNEWPAQYLFKFIVPSVGDNVQMVQNAFDSVGAIIVTKKSSGGKFTSVSIDVHMESSQQIIDIYLKVSTIEGIISL